MKITSANLRQYSNLLMQKRPLHEAYCIQIRTFGLEQCLSDIRSQREGVIGREANHVRSNGKE